MLFKTSLHFEIFVCQYVCIHGLNLYLVRAFVFKKIFNQNSHVLFSPVDPIQGCSFFFFFFEVFVVVVIVATGD